MKTYETTQDETYIRTTWILYFPQDLTGDNWAPVESYDHLPTKKEISDMQYETKNVLNEYLIVVETERTTRASEIVRHSVRR